MRIRPTELGVKGALLLAALFVAFLAAAYSNLFFLIIAFCAVLGILGGWWTCRNGRQLTVTLAHSPAAAAGHSRTLRLALDSKRPAFDLTIAVELRVDDRVERHELAHVPALLGQQNLTVDLSPQVRCVQQVTRLICSSRYPFGLVRGERDFTPDVATELVTYPNPGDGSGGRRHASSATDGPGGRRADSIAGLREFRSGDSLSEVHWKATARRGTPIVKERERAGNDAQLVVVDRRAESGTVFEAELAAATARLLTALDRERPVQIVSQGYTAAVAAGRDPALVLRWLADCEALPLSAAPPSLPREMAHA